jgi:hypothetical protein
LAEEPPGESDAGVADPSVTAAFNPSNPIKEEQHAEAGFEIFEEGQVVYANELLESPSSDTEESESATEANEHLPQEI